MLQKGSFMLQRIKTTDNQYIMTQTNIKNWARTVMF